MQVRFISIHKKSKKRKSCEEEREKESNAGQQQHMFLLLLLLSSLHTREEEEKEIITKMRSRTLRRNMTTIPLVNYRAHFSDSILNSSRLVRTSAENILVQ